jgi:hypothetical protein
LIGIRREFGRQDLDGRFRFKIGLTDKEKQDLVNFLSTL